MKVRFETLDGCRSEGEISAVTARHSLPLRHGPIKRRDYRLYHITKNEEGAEVAVYREMAPEPPELVIQALYDELEVLAESQRLEVVQLTHLTSEMRRELVLARIELARVTKLLTEHGVQI